MRLRRSFTAADERAVSPVIGVILMVSVTVILAAVIGSFVIGLGDQVQSTAPQASFSYDIQEDEGIMITHDGGEPIDTQVDALEVVHEGQTIAGTESGDGPVWTDDEVTAGIGLTERIDDGYEEGDEIRVVWRDGATGESVTMSTHLAAYGAPQD